MLGIGRRRALRLALLVAAFGLLPAAPARAHASLLRSAPTDSTVVAASPGEVALRCDEPASTALGSLTVLAPDGSRVDDGPARLRDDGRTVAVSLRPRLPHGTCTVLRRVMSADSHTGAGAETFSVVQPSPTAAGAAAGTAGARRCGAAVHGDLRC